MNEKRAFFKNTYASLHSNDSISLISVTVPPRAFRQRYFPVVPSECVAAYPELEIMSIDYRSNMEILRLLPRRFVVCYVYPTEPITFRGNGSVNDSGLLALSRTRQYAKANNKIIAIMRDTMGV